MKKAGEAFAQRTLLPCNEQILGVLEDATRNDEVSADGMLTVSHNVFTEKSTAGGPIVEHWLDFYSSGKLYRRYRSWIVRGDGRFVLTSSECKHFLGWLAVAGSTLHRGFQQLRMHLALIGKYFGLTRTGVEVFHTLGITPPLRSVDRALKNDVQQRMEKLK